ncbi:Uncharacterized protein Adt_38242 [Abeliophyllum distichum]|uniref:Uncharacterized protein n=1 Tax=Abeliophyllum distichum TaxID=126358 RepID=A0ABD1Q1N6_9LAMI
MNAYSSYNQISMFAEDEESTLFIIDWGSCCYKMMPLGVKNVGATYQRRLMKWSVELSQFEISYKLRPSIKGQMLADFMVGFTYIPEGLLKTKPQKVPTWKLYVDRSTGKVGAGARILLLALTVITSTVHFAWSSKPQTTPSSTRRSLQA